MARDVLSTIMRELNELLPDLSDDRAQQVADHLTSDVVGVRSPSMLYDVAVEDLQEILPRCDARKLHRIWRTKYHPSNVQRHLLVENVCLYTVDWGKVESKTMTRLQQGKRLTKIQRCAMIRAIVSDVMNSTPNVNRATFGPVAQSMVKDFPRSLQDRGRGVQPLQCAFLEKKLKCRYDEAIRPESRKSAIEAPSIPQAYGCVKWQVKDYPPNESKESITNKKLQLREIFEQRRERAWCWTEIENLMKVSFKMQRDDINSQVPPKRRNANRPAITPKSTKEISEEWPFLFQSRGMHTHFKILTGVDFLECMNTFEERIDTDDFIKFLGDYSDGTRHILKKYRRAVRRESCQAPHQVAIFLLLFKAFKETPESLFLEIEKTTLAEEVKNVAKPPPTPCLISFGPVFEAEKFVVAIDSEPISVVKKFWSALAIVFMAFFVFNVKYPANVGNTLEFYQRVIAGIDGKGSKINKKTSRTKLAEKLQTLIDAYACHTDDADVGNGSDAEDVDGDLEQGD